MVRSEKRAAPKAEGRAVEILLSTLYMCVTIALLIFVYPLGLILLWIKPFRANAAVKMALSIAACGAFVFVFSRFLGASAVDPRLAPFQAWARSTLSVYGSDSKVVVEEYDNKLAALPENVSNVTFYLIRYAPRAAAQLIAEHVIRHREITERFVNVLYVSLIRASRMFP